jgi:hypothetical protein
VTFFLQFSSAAAACLRNLRLQLTDSATEVNEIPQMFEWMEQTWLLGRLDHPPMMVDP